MHPLLAMAGLAEAAIAEALMIFGGVLLVALGLAALAGWKRWPVMGLTACWLCLMTGVFTQPWSVFHGPSTTDSDEAYWLVRERAFSIFWVLSFAVCIYATVRAVRRRKSRLGEQT